MPALKTNLISVYVLREGSRGMELLLLQRGPRHQFPGDWQAVHGHLEAGEAAWQAAEREVREETGLRPALWFRLHHIESFYNPENDSLYFVPTFVAVVDADSECTLSDEHQACRWCTLTEARELFAWETQRQSVDALSAATRTWPQPGPGLMPLDLPKLRRHADERRDRAARAEAHGEARGAG